MRKNWMVSPAVAIVLCSCEKKDLTFSSGATTALNVSIDRNLLADFAGA